MRPNYTVPIVYSKPFEDEGKYIIESPYSNQVWNIKDGYNTSSLQADTYAEKQWQIWICKETSTGYRFVNGYTQKAICLSEKSLGEGITIKQADVDSEDESQVFSVIDVGNGNYVLVNNYNMNVISLFDSLKVDSNSMCLNCWIGKEYQLWKFNLIDEKAPVISDVKITNETSSGYRVSCSVTDNVETTKVLFSSWTEKDGQDDKADVEGIRSGNTFYADIKISEHNMERGAYCTEIFAYDAANNEAHNDAVTVNVKDPLEIKYVLNGGINSKLNPGMYEYGIGIPSFANPTRKGYTFVGWYSDSDFKNKVSSISSSANEAVTLYAKWTVTKVNNSIKAEDISITAGKKARTVKLNVSALGGAKISFSSKTATVSADGNVTIPAKFVGEYIVSVVSSETDLYLATTKEVSITVLPQAPSLKTLKCTKAGRVNVTWKPVDICDGYEISYSTDKNFNKAKTVSVKKAKTKNKEIKLTQKKTFYVHVRSYKKVNGKKYYSAYGKAKKIKVK